MDWAFLPIFSKWTGLQICGNLKEEKIEKLSFGFRKKKDWNDGVKFEHLSDFQQILPTFCHGTKVKPWKFEKKITKMIVRLTFERGRKEEKKLNKQTNKGNFKK